MRGDQKRNDPPFGGTGIRPWNVYAKDIRAELDRQTRWPIDVQSIRWSGEVG